MKFQIHDITDPEDRKLLAERDIADPSNGLTEFAHEVRAEHPEARLEIVTHDSTLFITQ